MLTAWSVAAIVGPTLLTYLRAYQVAHGVAKVEAYTVTMYVMASLLVIGFVCNAMVGAVGGEHARKGGG